MAYTPPPLTVNEIVATPSFALSTTDPDETLTLPAFQTQIFDVNTPTKYVDTADPTQASLRPIAFSYPANVSTPKSFKIALKLAINLTAPPEWSVVPTSKVVVYGCSPSNLLKPVFQSDEVPVSTAKGTWSVDSMNVDLPEVMRKDGGKLPFKLAGTFVWTVMVVNNPALVSLPTPIPSVLELYFTNVSAPSGHMGTDGTPILARTPQFDQVYPLALLRRFWPSITDIPSGEPLRQEKLNEFYCQHIVTTLWALGNPHVDKKPQFDSVAGRSAYGVGALGGTFDLLAFDSLKYPLCNSFDLTAILHLACSLLLTSYEAELVQPTWVLNDKLAFVVPGQFYGLSDASVSPCNNPFWKAFARRPETTCMIDAASKSRTAFYRHAWLEVSMYDPKGVGPYKGVLDVSFVPSAESDVQPDGGSRNRETYLLNRLDKTRRENGIVEISPNVFTIVTEGDQFYTTGDREYMVGVVSTNLTYPVAPFLQGDDTLVGISNAPMPVKLKSDINALLKAGDSGARGNRMIVVDAPLDADSLAAALKPLDATASATALSRSVFHTINTFSSSFKAKAGEFNAVFESYQSYMTAKARLVHYLTTYSIGPLADFVKAAPKLDQPIGHICLWIGSEVVIVYGNLFAQITVTSSDGLTPDLWKTISSLFQFIKTNTTGKITDFNPLEELGPERTIAVKSGATVPILLEKEDNEVLGTMALIHSSSEHDTGKAYLWQMKAGESSGKFTFRVAGYGEMKVVLSVGNATKGLVRSVSYTVSISPA
ncbi:hypothetical protein TWF694_001885 [Orbilia ellipsospora]|uniref:Uncharacterized protein n=1 Tax=Orbilia ellipsospora TaxID=2528407 RepID=A0AAV9X3Z2_9PEZI